MNSFQKSLLYNSIFSFLTGIISLIFNTYLANIFKINDASIFEIMGVLLILFSTSILIIIKNKSPKGMLLIISMDILWVIGSFIILSFNIFDISFWGNIIIGSVALIVLFMAYNQSISLVKIDSHDNQKIMKFTRVYGSKLEDVWDIISDVANYHTLAPNIDSVEIMEGKGENMIRKCAHKNSSWTEKCTFWEENKKYSFLVDTSAADYPFPFAYLRGNWEVEQISHGSTKLIMEFHFKYTKKIHNLLLHPFLRAKFDDICKELMENVEEEIKVIS